MTPDPKALCRKRMPQCCECCVLCSLELRYAMTGLQQNFAVFFGVNGLLAWMGALLGVVVGALINVRP